MPNTFNTLKNAPGIIAKAAAQELADNLKFLKSIDTAPASEFDGKNGYMAGDTIYTNVPARYVPQTNGFDITSSIQDSVEEKRALTLNITSTVPMQFNSIELATEVGLKSVINRFVRPAAQSIAQDVERRMLQQATQAVYNQTGVAGSTAYTVADIQAAKVLLDENLAPMDETRYLLLNSRAGAAAVDARKGLFQSSDEIAKQYKSGYIGMADSFNWMQNELLYTHTNGNDVSGITVNAAPTEGATSIVLTGVTANTGTITAGTTFTIAGVFRVHPITKQVTSQLQQFVATNSPTANGSGQVTVNVSPAFYAASGGLRNISALPASSAAVTLPGAASTAYNQGLAFHKGAFKMASVPLMLPNNVEFAAQETVEGVTVAVIQAFDVLQRRLITRLDFLGGISAVRPEWACRITA